MTLLKISVMVNRSFYFSQVFHALHFSKKCKSVEVSQFGFLNTIFLLTESNMWSDYGGVGNDYRGYDTDSVLQNHEHLPQDSNYQYSPAHHSNPMTINKEPPKEQPTYNNDSSTTEIIRYDDTILQALLWDNETAKPEPTPAKSSEANMQYLNYNGCKLMNQIAGEETQLQHNDQNTALEPSVGQGLDHNNWHSYDSTCSLSDTQQTSQFNIMDMNNCSCGVFNDDLDTFLMGQNAYIKSQQKKADVDAAESKPIYHPETQANPRFKKGRTANANIEYNPMFKDNIDFNHMTTTTVNVPTSRSLPIPGNRPPQDTKWTVGEIQRIIDNPTNPLGKFLRDTQISAEFAEHTNLMSFLTLVTA